MKPKQYTKAVIDVIPWSEGQGFQHSSTWWDYVLSKTEQEKLELLFMIALLSTEVKILLLGHDQDLLKRFAFSDQTFAFLTDYEANNLSELAAAVAAYWATNA